MAWKHRVRKNWGHWGLLHRYSTVIRSSANSVLQIHKHQGCAEWKSPQHSNASLGLYCLLLQNPKISPKHKDHFYETKLLLMADKKCKQYRHYLKNSNSCHMYDTSIWPRSRSGFKLNKFCTFFLSSIILPPTHTFHPPSADCNPKCRMLTHVRKHMYAALHAHQTLHTHTYLQYGFLREA